MEWNDQTQTLQVREKKSSQILESRFCPSDIKDHLNQIWMWGMFSLLRWAWLEVESEYFGMEGLLKCTKPNHQNHFPFAFFSA